MSLSALSSELDLLIIGYLAGNYRSLDALARVSRYYYSKAVTIMYGYVDLKKDRGVMLERLTQTILRRPDLALHIRTITRRASSYPSYRIRLMQCKTLQPELRSISDLIDGFLGDDVASKLRNDWIHSFKILDDCVDLSYATSLALVFSLATNIETIDIKSSARGNSLLAETISFLSSKNTSLMTTGGEITQVGGAQTNAYSKLKRLHLSDCGKFDLEIFPWLESLEISQSEVNLSIAKNCPNSLKKLSLQKVDITVKQLKDLIATGALQNLTSLSLFDAPNKVLDSDVPNLVLDCTSLKEAMCLHLPHLEHLEWCGEPSWGMPDNFARGDLIGLKGLKTLKIDCHFLFGVSQSDLLVLSPEHVSLIPPQLQSLELLGMSYMTLSRLFYDASPDMAAEYARDLASQFALSNLHITMARCNLMHFYFGLTPMPSIEMRDILQSISSELSTVGVHFEALYPGKFKIAPEKEATTMRDDRPWWEIANIEPLMEAEQA